MYNRGRFFMTCDVPWRPRTPRAISGSASCSAARWPRSPRQSAQEGLRRSGAHQVGDLRGVPRRRRQQRHARLADARGPACDLHRAPAARVQERRAHRRHDEAVRRHAVGARHARRGGLLRGAERRRRRARIPRSSGSASRSIAAAYRPAASRPASPATAPTAPGTRSPRIRASAASMRPTRRNS